MIKTEHLSDSVTLYLGDCREVLPTLAPADIVVTSPPYNTLPASAKASGMHAERKSGVNLWLEKAATGYADQKPEPEYQAWLNGILLACADRAKGLVWVNHKVRYRDCEAIHPARMIPLPIYAEVIWNRGGSMALNCKRFAPSHEGIWAFGAPHYWDDRNNTLMSVWNVPHAQRDGGNDHPCPYPDSVVRPLIESSCPPGGTVLDPFMGSGTTGCATVKTGRRFVGIEIALIYLTKVDLNPIPLPSAVLGWLARPRIPLLLGPRMKGHYARRGCVTGLHESAGSKRGHPGAMEGCGGAAQNPCGLARLVRTGTASDWCGGCLIARRFAYGSGGDYGNRHPSWGRRWNRPRGRSPAN